MTLVSAGQMAKLSEKSIHTELLEYFDIPVNLLPKPQKFGSEVGAIKAHASAELSTRWTDVKVFVGGGDSHFLHMGASVTVLQRQLFLLAHQPQFHFSVQR